MDIELKIDGKIFKVSKIIVGGLTDDETRSPVGMFCGDMEPVEACMMIETSMRAFIKLLHNEGEVPMRELEKALLIAVEQAVEAEENYDPLNNVPYDIHEQIVMKWSQKKEH